MCKELIDYFLAAEKLAKLESSINKTKRIKAQKQSEVPDTVYNTLIEIKGKLYFFDGSFNEVKCGS